MDEATTKRARALIRRAAGRRLVTVTAATGWGKSQLASAWAVLTGGTLVTMPTGPVEPSTPLPTLTGGTHSSRSLADVLAEPGSGWLVIDGVSQLGTVAGRMLREHLLLAPRPMLLTGTDSLAGFSRGVPSLEIGPTQLRLDVDEVTEWLLRDQGDDSPATRIMSVTQGWPAAVRILIDVLHDQPRERRAAAVHDTMGPHGQLGRFFRGVLAEQSRPTLEALTRLALGAVPPAGSTVVAEVVQSGLITEEPDTGRLAVVPGLQGHLLGPHLLGESPFVTLVDDVAATQVGGGDVAAAVRTLTGQARTDQLAQLLEDHGDHLVRSGELRLVCAAAEALPTARRSPTIRQTHAHALAYRGAWTEALRCLEGLGTDGDSPLPAGLALVLGNIHHFRGETAQALAAYRRAVPGDDGLWAETLAWRSGAHWLLGEADDASGTADRALAVAEEIGADRALAVAHNAMAMAALNAGDWRANGVHYRHALGAAERASDELARARILTNLGSRHIENAEYTTGLEYTDLAISLAEAQGFAMVSALARCNRAEAWLRTGAIDVAVADAELSRDAYARLGSPAEGYAHCILGDARREQGRLVQARVAYERALDLAGVSGDQQTEVHALIGLSRILADTDPRRAQAAAQRAREVDPGVMGVESRLAEAWVELAIGDAEAAGRGSDEAWAEARQRDNRAALAEAATLQAVISTDPVSGLRDAAHLWHEADARINATRVELGAVRRQGPGSVEAMALERQLTAAGCSPHGGTFVDRLVTGIDDLPPLVIRSLGTFSIERHGKPLPHSAWRSGKARELLKMLIVFQDRRLTREEAAHLLWPDEPYPEVSNRLSVALSLLRSTLGKDIETPVVVEGQRIALNPDGVDLDVVRFRQAAEKGLGAARTTSPARAVEPLTLAEQSYAGDLLEEDRYVDWIDEARDHLRSLYIAATRTLAGILEADAPERALVLWLRVLDRDPYDERVHHDICRVLMSSGQHGEARRRHRVYSGRMAELGLPAVPLPDLRGLRRG